MLEILVLSALAAGLATEPPEAAVARAEHALFEALTRQDGGGLDALLSDRFVLRGSPDVEREAWIEAALDLCWGDRFDIEDLGVEARGDTAIASFVVSTYSDPFTCEEATLRSLITDVWERHPGGWRLAVRHAGPAGSPDDPAFVRLQFTTLPEPPPVWVGHAELSTVSTSGNSESDTLGFRADFRYSPDGWTTELATSVIRSRADGVESARAFGIDVRQARRVSSRLELYGHTGYYRDRFAGVANRWVGDAGVALTVLDRAGHFLRFDTGLGFLHEDRLVGDTLRAPTGTVVAAYRWRANDRIEFGHSATMTLNLEEAAGWRFRDVAALTATLTRILSLRLSQTVDYVNTPVEGFGRTDRTLSMAVVVGFRH